MEPKSKHQFSLGRLPIAVTVIALVLAPAISFPVATAELVSVNLLLIAPSAVVFGIAFWLSKNRRRTAIMLFAGIFLGWLLAPQLFVSWSRPPTFWDEFRIDFDTIGGFMFGGAIAAANLDFTVMLATHKPKTEQRRITNGSTEVAGIAVFEWRLGYPDRYLLCLLCDTTQATPRNCLT